MINRFARFVVVFVMASWGLSIATVLNGAQASSSDKRVATLEDFFRFQDLGDVFASPDGKFVAYTLTRPMGVGSEPSSLYDYAFADRQGVGRKDVYVVPTSGGPAQNITQGADDGAFFWDPQWSPDGRKLMMVSSRNGGIRIWIWTRSTGVLKQLSSRHVLPATERYWLSPDDVLFTSPLNWPYDSPPNSKAVGGFEVAQVSAEGSSVEVLRSGLSERPPENAEFVMANVESGVESLVASTNGMDFEGLFRHILVPSPDRKWIAFLRQADTRPIHPDELYDEANNPDASQIFEVDVVNLSHPGHTARLNGSAPITLTGLSCLYWSPDSTELAILSFQSSYGALSAVRRCDLKSLSCRSLDAKQFIKSSDDLSVGSEFMPWTVVWYGEHGLFVHCHRQREPTRDLWWSLGEGNLTPRLSNSSSSQMFGLTSPAWLIGIKDGQLWRMDDSGKPVAPVSVLLNRGITSIRMVEKNSIVVETTGPEGSPLFVINPEDAKAAELNRPSPAAKLVGFQAESQTAVFADTTSRTQLWTVRPTHNPTLLLETNQFVEQILPFSRRTVSYLTEDGEKVGANIYLPEDYRVGKKYPVLVNVYPGTDLPSIEQTIEEPIRSASMFDFQILANHGYVVLDVSIPNLNPSVFSTAERRARAGQDRCFEVRKGVFPALDKLVSLGIADPDRLGLFGHSYGGYATYCLLAQTNRFKAAVGSGGWVNLFDAYLMGETRSRYARNSPLPSPMAVYIELNLGLRGPPWEDFVGYLRNSPLFYVDRISTPVMMVEGDMDPSSLQSEEFFAALKRQQKRADFVNYLGECHVFQSPANLYDLNKRLFAWFDEFLKPSFTAQPTYH